MSVEVNPAHEREARAFIEDTLRIQLGPNLQEELKSGVVLCNFLNALKPGTITNINKGKMPFAQMENIAAYIKACKQLGIPDHYNFMTVDLYENKNMAQVILNINTLKRHLGYGFEKATPPAEKTVTVIEEREEPRRDPSAFSPRSEPTTTGAAYKPGVAAVTAESGTKTCAICNLPISLGCINACNRYYHTKCFTCKKCPAKLASAKYYEHDRQPYCEKCIFIVAPGKKIPAQTVDKGFSF